MCAHFSEPVLMSVCVCDSVGCSCMTYACVLGPLMIVVQVKLVSLVNHSCLWSVHGSVIQC